MNDIETNPFSCAICGQHMFFTALNARIRGARYRQSEARWRRLPTPR